MEKERSEMIRTKDCKCVICGKQAVVFWPCIDPDIPTEPYCRKCLDKVEREIILKLLDNGVK